jgi:hypothetical protein
MEFMLQPHLPTEEGLNGPPAEILILQIVFAKIRSRFKA